MIKTCVASLLIRYLLSHTMTCVGERAIPTLSESDSVDLNGSTKRRRISWGTVKVAIILDETDFSGEREAVIDNFENEECRVARIKAAHRARVAERKKREK